MADYRAGVLIQDEEYPTAALDIDPIIVYFPSQILSKYRYDAEED